MARLGRRHPFAPIIKRLIAFAPAPVSRSLFVMNAAAIRQIDWHPSDRRHFAPIIKRLIAYAPAPPVSRSLFAVSYAVLTSCRPMNMDYQSRVRVLKLRIVTPLPFVEPAAVAVSTSIGQFIHGPVYSTPAIGGKIRHN